jgi:hypothetical protein
MNRLAWGNLSQVDFTPIDSRNRVARFGHIDVTSTDVSKRVSRASQKTFD